MIWPGRLHAATSRRTKGAATGIRELVTAVIVNPAGREEPKIEVTGRLANLTEAPRCSRQASIVGQQW